MKLHHDCLIGIYTEISIVVCSTYCTLGISRQYYYCKPFDLFPIELNSLYYDIPTVCKNKFKLLNKFQK